MSYDSWKTTPPDDTGYCPQCLRPLEDSEEVEEDGEKLIHCVECDEKFSPDAILTKDEARRIAREDAADDENEARREREAFEW